jgi:ankyrin repeat protein
MLSPRPLPVLLLGAFFLAAVQPLEPASSAPANPRPESQPAGPGKGKPGPKEKETAAILALIDQLAQVAEGDVGYSASVTGSAFLPLDTAGQVHTALLFQKPLTQSDPLRELVKRGAAALPHLLAHLNDGRKTPLQVTHEHLIGGMWFSEEFDRNRRTDKPLKGGKAEDGKQPPRQTAYTVTVGDLCFVAIGQIVNRSDNAVRYQPTAIIIVNAPTRSRALRGWVEQSWASLTPQQHRASLVADFRKPDREGRRLGACKRLAYYYPDALEPLALKLLLRPTYSVFGVEAFVRDKLYREPDPKKCQALFDAYLARHGEAAGDGILLQLFGDLERLEAHEEKRVHPPLKEFSDQPRKLLIQLYGKPKTVKSEDVPYVESLSEVALARLIGEGLIHDGSEKLDRVVRGLLVTCKDDDYLAQACIKRLLGRGYDADLEAYCRRRLPQLTEDRDREPLRGILGKLGWTRLHVAVDRNDRDGVRALLHRKAPVDAAGRGGQTPLHLAARAGNGEAVRLLVQAGASLDPTDKAGQTPVQLAVREDHMEVVRVLAGRGCSVPDVLVAACVGRADRLGALLKTDPKAARSKTRSGQTPLHLAAVFGQAKVVKPLLAAGLPVDARDEDGRTPLHQAATFGSAAVARELIRSGGAVRAAAGEENVEPLHLAAYRGHAQVAEALLDAKVPAGVKLKGTELTPLHLAAASGQAEAVKLLLRRGAAVDATDAVGRTALHLAAENNRAEAAERLLAGKAGVSAKDQRGWTPLHRAAKAGHAPLVRVLLEHRANVGAKDEADRTPADLAREAGHTDVVRLLKAKGPKR